MSIETILRGNYVRRFHANPDLAHVGDTNGHHQAMVAQIVLWLKPDAGTDLLHEALHHDSAEQFVGDLPYPFKVAADKGFVAYHTELERLARVRIGAARDLDEADAAILKLADRLAAYLHIRHVAPHVLTGSGWPEDRKELVARAWAISADVAAKVEGVLAR